MKDKSMHASKESGDTPKPSPKNPPPSVFEREAKRLVEEAEVERMLLRVMGALAIRMHSPEFADLHRGLKRLGESEFPDIDLMSIRECRKRLPGFFQARGYTYDKALMAIYGSKRHIYYGTEIPVVDVFFDQLAMCHVIDLRGRIRIDFPTVSLADLLLGKMQIVKLNLKDVKDTVVLLRAHDVGGSDDETINCRYIAELLSQDWGFYHTVTTNLKRIRDDFLSTLEVLDQEDIADVRGKVNEILEAIEREDKSLKWRMRAKIGTRKKWYQEVEEVIR